MYIYIVLYTYILGTWVLHRASEEICPSTKDEISR